MKRDVCLRVQASLPQRLVQEAERAGISLAEASCPDGERLVVRLSPSGARAFTALCERWSLPVEVVRVSGSGAILAYLKSRITLLAGVAVFLALTLLALGRVWRVDIQFTGSAADAGERAAIEEALSGLGIHPGMSARGVDPARLSESLSARLPGYSYVGAKRQGVRLLIEAAPEVDRPELYALDAPRDLYARQDGIVVSVNVRAGEPCVRPGDTVRRGQLLIRGEEKARDDGTRAIAALGEVVVRAWVEGEAALPEREVRVVPTGRESAASALTLFDLRLPLSAGEVYPEQRVDVERLPVGGLFLPMEILRETRREVRAQAEGVDGATLEARLAALARADARIRFYEENPGDYAILREWLQYEDRGGGRSARAVLEITTDTAVEREALYQGGTSAWKAANSPEPHA